MSLADVSIKRPIFITCTVIVMIAVGWLSLRKLGIDLFPNITFPVVTVSTPYPGAGPSEVETLVSKILEDEIASVSGIKAVRSINQEGLSRVVAEFTLETDVKFAEQQIRDRVASAKRKLPSDAKESTIRRIDPADQPILVVAVKADLPPAELFDLTQDDLRLKLEQVNQVGLVEVIGGRKREILIELDRQKLKSFEISASQVSARMAATGQNIPLGKVDEAKNETVFRTIGQFKSLQDIQTTIVNFLGNDVPVSVNQVGKVVDSLATENSRTFVNGDKTIFLMVFRQSGSNTIAVVEAVKKRIALLQDQVKLRSGNIQIDVVRDGSRMIKANVDDVKESIFIGIALTIIVVFLFLGSARSTIITGLALPNSLMGAFILMSLAGFTINVMTLLALSLAVGLLIDDAIVVRENIFRHVEMGKRPIDAARIGTKEVTLAVVATTLAVLSVFGPVGFLKGVVGQFFREFAFTICFAMVISLFDALTIAPMLSAYFAGSSHIDPKSLYGRTIGLPLRAFAWFQDRLEDFYVVVLRGTVRFPIMVLLAAAAIFGSSLLVLKSVPKTFLGAQDTGEFAVGLDMPPGTNLESMSQVALAVDTVIRSNKEVLNSVLVVGSKDGAANIAEFYVLMVPAKQRPMNTSEFKDMLRTQLKTFAYANPKVKDYDMVAAGLRPFTVNISGPDLEKLEATTKQAFDLIKTNPALLDVDISYRPGKPEVQIIPDKEKAARLGISTTVMGQELRNQIEGTVPALFRENGKEYDIRVRLKDDQRNLKEAFQSTWIPNINNTLIPLSRVATIFPTVGPSAINRQDRARYIQISADITPGGPGMSAAMADVTNIFANVVKLPSDMRFNFVGQAENFKELVESMITATGLAILFIYLVLASLYESFVTPLTIMLVLPLAACGAFFALRLTNSSLDLNSMIGMILLLGIASKNSILLVDYANSKVLEGMDCKQAMLEAGKTRLRPILMTTVALIAGMLPIAIGLNEASRQRTSMGIAVIGGLISSTFLTLLVIPAAYSYIDRYRVWSSGLLGRIFMAKGP